MNLTQDAEYMLMAESTTLLDIKYQNETPNLLKHLNQQGRTIVAKLHDLTQTPRYSSALIMMNQGRIQSIGTPENVVNTNTTRQVFGIGCEIFTDP